MYNSHSLMQLTGSNNVAALQWPTYQRILNPEFQIDGNVIVAIKINVTSDINQTNSYITSCNKLVIDCVLAPQARYWHSSDVEPEGLQILAQ